MLNYIDIKYKPSKKDIILSYYVESNIDFRKTCEQIAAESSIGTWTKLSTMNKGIAVRLKPHIFSMKKTGAKSGYIKIAYNHELFEEGSIPQLLSSVAGNIFGMRIVKNLRLLDIEFPDKYIRGFKGPKFGIAGVRKLFKIKKRPLVGTIVKPKVGLTSKQHARVAYESWIGGCDVVKDDENLTSLPFNRFDERLREVMKMKEKAELKTGEKKGYMVNVTAETGTMLHRMDLSKESGNEYAMVDILTTGFSALQTVRNYNEEVGLIIHAHRAMHAAITKNKKHGISMLAIAKIARLIGVDQLHIGTGVGKMEGSKLEVREIEDEMEDNFFSTRTVGKGLKSKETKSAAKINFLEQEWHSIRPVFAVTSGGLYPGLVPKLMNFMGNNIIIQAGGGIHGHPHGTRAGATAMRQAVDSVLEGISLKEYSKHHKELREAIKLWGYK